MDEDATVIDRAKVKKDGLVLENAIVSGQALVTDLSWVAGAMVGDRTTVGGNAVISGQGTVVTGERYIIKGIIKTESA